MIPVVRLVKNGDYWRAVWTDALGRRQYQGLGSRSKVSKRKANEEVARIQAELAAADPRASGFDRRASLAAFTKAYLHSRSVNPRTLALDADTASLLTEHFGDVKLRAIGTAEADAWVKWLAEDARTFKGTRLSPHTVAGHLRRARAMWSSGIRYGVVDRNPFATVRHTVPKSAPSLNGVTAEAVAKIIEAAPTPAWRALIGLCAYAGLRRGEAITMPFDGWRSAERKLLVPSVKTDARTCLLVPELDELILAAHEDADVGQEIVCGKVSPHNLNRNIETIIRRAGLEPWPKGFHTLRRWRATTWRAEYPEHVVDAWLGHSLEVARQHYAGVPESYYAGTPDAKADRIAELEAELRALKNTPGARC